MEELQQIADRMLGVLDDCDPGIQAIVLLSLENADVDGVNRGVGARGYEGDYGEIATDIAQFLRAVASNNGGSVQIIWTAPGELN